jgi:hypothetical protein
MQYYTRQKGNADVRFGWALVPCDTFAGFLCEVSGPPMSQSVQQCRWQPLSACCSVGQGVLSPLAQYVAAPQTRPIPYQPAQVPASSYPCGPPPSPPPSPPAPPPPPVPPAPPTCAPPQNKTFVCDAESINCYVYVATAATFDAARAYCKQRKGELVRWVGN